MGPWQVHSEECVALMATKSSISGIPHKQQFGVARTHWVGPVHDFAEGAEHPLALPPAPLAAVLEVAVPVVALLLGPVAVALPAAPPYPSTVVLPSQAAIARHDTTAPIHRCIGTS